MKKLSSAVLCLFASVLLLAESAAFAFSAGAEGLSGSERGLSAFSGVRELLRGEDRGSAASSGSLSKSESERLACDARPELLSEAQTKPSACKQAAAGALSESECGSSACNRWIGSLSGLERGRAGKKGAVSDGSGAESALRDGEETVTVRRPEAEETDGGGLKGPGADAADARLDKAETAIRDCLGGMEETLDLQAYGLTKDELKDIFSAILNSTPELFYVGNSYKIKLSAGKIVTFSPIYLYTAEELPALKAVYEQKLSEILALIEPDMTDLQKLLLLNDYFCLEYRYDDTHAVYDTLRFFTEKTGVCQAYTLALTAVLERLGIPVTYAQSTEMNHIWNLVQLDGKWYHLDLTWNDPLDDRFGRALHENFLRSDAGIAATGHYGWSVPGEITCTDTSYDNYFWKSVKTPFAYTEKAFFYMDDGVLYRVNLQTQEKTVLLTVPDRWAVQDKPGYSYSTSYSCLAAYDGCLFYTTPGAVMRYRLSTGKTERYFAPALSSGQLFAFYGLGGQAHWLSASGPEFEKTLLGTGSLQLTGAAGTEKTVLLTGSDAFTRFCPTMRDALSLMSDPDLSYTVTPFLPAGRFDLSGVRELPAAGSITLTGSGATRLELDGSVTLRSALHLNGVLPVGTTASGAILVQSYILTVTAKTPQLSVRVSGGTSSSLVILSTDGGEITLSAPVSVGTFVTEGTVRLRAVCSAGTFRTTGDCRLLAEDDFTCGTVSGTGALTLSCVKRASGTYPALRITGRTSGSVTFLFDPERKLGDAVLYAPEASDIAFRLKSDRYDPDLAPLFERGADGWFRFVRETYMRIEDGILVSFVSAAPQERVEVPSGVTGIGNYAFASCPEPGTVFLPAGITEIGAFGIGYSYDAAEKLYVSDRTVYEVAKDSVCEAYAAENGLLYDSYLEGTVGDFAVRVYPTRGEAWLLRYTGDGPEAVLPASVSLGGTSYADILYAEGLFDGKKELVIYCPVPRGELEPADVWEKTYTLYCSGEWFMVVFTSEGTVYHSYPALKDSAVLLPAETPVSSASGTPEYTLVFFGWEGYTEGMRVTEALSFRAVFTQKVRTYTYTFYAEDGVTVLKRETAEYGTYIMPPKEPEKPPLEDGTVFWFDGWSGYLPGMVLTKNISFYAKYVEVGRPITEITSLYYRIDRAFGYVRKIDAATNGEIFISGFQNSANMWLTAADGTALVPDMTVVGTGMTVSLVVKKLEDGELKDEVRETLTLVVTGDLNGDGLVTLTDFVLLKSHLLGIRVLSGAYMEAADLTGDGEVTLTDFIRLKACLLGTEELEPQ